MIAVLMIGLMALLAILYVAIPLLRVRPEAAPDDITEAALPLDDPDLEMDDLFGQRDAVYRAIKEIEFDHQIGNLSDEDFADLRERYKAKALLVLRAIREREQGDGTVDDEADEEATAATDVIEQAISKRRRARKADLVCAPCGITYEPGNRFCSRCGRPLGSCCPSCGEPCDNRNAFCVSCGSRLQSAGRAAARTSR